MIATGVVGEAIPGSAHTSLSRGTRSPGTRYPASHHAAVLMRTQTRVRAAGPGWEVLA